jgi:hypothetical protein
LVLDVVPFVPAGEPLVAGVAVGNDVIGVGTSGKGFARIPATSSFSPASDLVRYL